MSHLIPEDIQQPFLRIGFVVVILFPMRMAQWLLMICQSRSPIMLGSMVLAPIPASLAILRPSFVAELPRATSSRSAESGLEAWGNILILLSLSLVILTFFVGVVGTATVIMVR